MKGCRLRRGREFKEVFLLVVVLVFDQHQNTRDELVVLEP